MKKMIFIFILLLVCQLDAKKLYFDLGIGFDHTRTRYLKNEKIEFLDGRPPHDYATFPNFSLSLGYRFSEKFVFISDFQTINLNGKMSYKYKSNSSGNIWHENTELCPLYYIGIGPIYYPNPSIQLGFAFGIPWTTPSLGNGFLDLGGGLKGSVAYEIYKKDKTNILLGYRLFLAEMVLLFDLSQFKSYSLISNGLFIKLNY